MSLYFQPTAIRSQDSTMAVAPSEGLDIPALIDQLTNRILASERLIEQKVSSKSLAKILLTEDDISIMADKISLVGQINMFDWVRDVSGNITGGIDPSSMTRIVGGKIQTGVVESVNWTTTTGSQLDLDNGTIRLGGSAAPKFSVSTAGVVTCQDAIVHGTLQAGSILTNSITVTGTDRTLAQIDAGATGYSATTLQANLDSGVAKILAGVGSDYRLNVDVTGAFVTLAHKDAVYKGTATSGSVKPAVGISSTGIAMGYNRSSDGAWVSSVAIDASGNAAFAGTISANSIITNSCTVDGVSMSTIKSGAADGVTALAGLSDKISKNASYVLEASSEFKTSGYAGGNGMIFTNNGILAKSGGANTFVIASDGTATFSGTVSAGAITSSTYIDVSGYIKASGNSATTATLGGDAIYTAVYGVMPGATTNSYSAGVVGHNTYTGTSGVGYIGVLGISDNTTSDLAYGVVGSAQDAGVYGVTTGTTSSNFGVLGLAVGSAYALYGSGLVYGTSNISGNTLTSRVSTGTTPLVIASTTKVDNLNADLLDGYHESYYLRWLGTDPASGSTTYTLNNAPASKTLVWVNMTLNGVAGIVPVFV